MVAPLQEELKSREVRSPSRGGKEKRLRETLRWHERLSMRSGKELDSLRVRENEEDEIKGDRGGAF